MFSHKDPNWNFFFRVLHCQGGGGGGGEKEVAGKMPLKLLWLCTILMKTRPSVGIKELCVCVCMCTHDTYGCVCRGTCVGHVCIGQSTTLVSALGNLPLFV